MLEDNVGLAARVLSRCFCEGRVRGCAAGTYCGCSVRALRRRRRAGSAHRERREAELCTALSVLFALFLSLFSFSSFSPLPPPSCLGPTALPRPRPFDQRPSSFLSLSLLSVRLSLPPLALSPSAPPRSLSLSPPLSVLAPQRSARRPAMSWLGGSHLGRPGRRQGPVLSSAGYIPASLPRTRPAWDALQTADLYHDELCVYAPAP